MEGIAVRTLEEKTRGGGEFESSQEKSRKPDLVAAAEREPA